METKMKRFHFRSHNGGCRKKPLDAIAESTTGSGVICGGENCQAFAFARELESFLLSSCVVVPWEFEKTEWNIELDDARHFSGFSLERPCNKEN